MTVFWISILENPNSVSRGLDLVSRNVIWLMDIASYLLCSGYSLHVLEANGRLNLTWFHHFLESYLSRESVSLLRSIATSSILLAMKFIATLSVAHEVPARVEHRGYPRASILPVEAVVFCLLLHN